MHEAVEILKLTNMNITKINFMTFAECRGINPTSHPGNQRKLIIDYYLLLVFVGIFQLLSPPPPSIIIIINGN